MKKFLYVIIALLVVYLVLAMIGPKEITVERSISIDKPASFVATKMGDFKFFNDEWNPFAEKDPNMKTEYKGNPGEVGHLYSWDGNKDVGTGDMEIMSLKGDTLDIRFGMKGMGDSQVYFITKDKGNTTEASWVMIMEIGFMRRPIMLFINMDKALGEYFEKGLIKLKTKLESAKEETPVVDASSHEVKEIEWPAKTFYGTKKVKMNGVKLKDFFSENFPKLMSELEKEKIQSCMSPCGLFYSWDQKTMMTECAAAFCVPEGKEIKGWEKYTIPASRVLHAPHYGDPANSIEAHYAIDEYMKSKKLDYTFVIEEYVTNPMEKDTSKWLTNIYYILK